MNLKVKGLYAPLILCILIKESTGIDSNESSQDENPSDTRRRMIKSYSGSKPEPIICTGEGFVEDPHNCAMFYRCIKSGNNKFTLFRFQCAPGTVYDPNHEVCNHPRSTTRSECGGISPTFIPTTHINEIQDNVYNEIPSPMVSSKPVHPLYTLQTLPLYAANSTTELYISSTPASSYPWASSINPTNIDHNIHETTVKPVDTEIKTSNPIYRDNTCTTDGFMGDKENCRKFYRCVASQRGGFTKFEFMCSETTVWDEVNQICNHVWAVKKSRCSLYNEKTSDSNTQITTEKLHIPDKNRMEVHIKENPKDNIIVNTIQHQLQIGYGTKVTQSQIQIGNGFVGQNQTQINYGDQLNKNTNKGSKQNQTQISHGSAISQSQTQIDYGDKGFQTQLQIDHSKDASQNQIQISESSTNKGTTIMWHSTNQEEHNTDCTEDGFIGDSNNCQKFYRCVNNGRGGFEKFEFNCADGTAWDPSIKSCNHIWAVKGCNLHGSVESSSHTVLTTTYKTTQGYHTTMSTKHTTAHYIEDNEDSDSSGYGNPNAESMPIRPSSTTITTVHDSNGTECLSNGFIGDSNDCKIFYRCVEDGNGVFTKHMFKCGEGTLWDPEIKACNHAWAVVKCSGNISPDINNVDATTENTKSSTHIYVQNTTSTYLPTVSANEESDDNNLPGYGSSNNEIQTTTTPHPPIWVQQTTESIPLDEKCTQSGFMGSSSDCKRFYRCVDDENGSYIKYEFLCGEGTLWDQELKSCNHAWAVTKCGSNGVSISINNEFNHTNPDNVNADTQISSTTTASSNSADSTKHETASDLCVSSGFFGDAKHCDKFYRCVDDGKGNLVRYEYVCGEGTVWDQSLKACNHRWAVKECGFNKNTTTKLPSDGTTEYTVILTTKYDDSTVTQNTTEIVWSKNDSHVICIKEGFIADPINCKSFYRCVNDGKGGLTKYQYSCGEGTYWNQEILSCDHITSSKICEPNYSFTTESPHTQEDNNMTTISSDDSHEQASPSKPIETLVTCTSEGFYGDQLNCRKYYRCVNNGNGGFIMYKFICGEGTSWDEEIQACNHESSSRCADLALIQTTENPSPQESGSTTSDRHNTSSTSVEKCELEGFFAVPNDCKKFIRCVSNNQGGFIKYEFTCSEGTVWVQEMLTCYHDTGEAYCSTPIITEPVKNEQHPQTTENYVPSISEHLPADQIDKDESTIKPPSNSADTCLSEGYYSDENDCTRFYHCVNDGKGSYIKYDYICGEGTAWDPNIGICNHIDNVSSCKESEMPDADNTETTENSESTTQRLTSSTISTSTSNSPDSDLETVDVCESEGYFGNTQDCKKFYRCVNTGKGQYIKYDFICAEGTIWDKDIPTCNHPENVANPSCQKITNTSNSTSNSTESNEGLSETSKTPENNSINCTKAGFYPNPHNCKKFYRCVDWDGNESKFSIFHFECGEGTIWDPTIDTCNHEDSVYPPRNCGASQVPVTEQTTTTEKESTTKSQENTETTMQSSSTSSTQSTTTTKFEEITTEQSVETTTDHSGGGSTEQPPESTTEGLGEITTEHTGHTTTEQSGETTTEQLGESTTEKLRESTTEKLGESTTEKLEESTTEKLKESTTEGVGESTTEKIGENTTGEQTESTSTTEQLSESTTIENTATAGLGTDQTTTEQIETTESGTDNSTQKPTGSDCPQTDNDQNLFVCPSSFRRHPRFCNLFYQCDENEDTHELKIALFTCPNNTIYDENKTKCVNESKAEKSCDGEISQKRRVKRKERIGDIINDPLVVSEESYGCSKTGYFAFEKKGDCSRGFLKCTPTKSNKLRGLVYQCPKSYVFWNVSKRCEPLHKVSDCKRSLINDWSRRSEIPIERQNVAW